MRLLTPEQRTFLGGERKEMLVIILMISIVSCCSFVEFALPWKPIEGFNAAQNIWYKFVLLNQYMGTWALMFAGMLGVRRALFFSNGTGIGALKPTNTFFLTRPVSRRFYFWERYGAGAVQTMVFPLLGTLLMYLAFCAWAYPHNGWVGGGMGSTPTVPPAGGHALERYKDAMDTLAGSSVLKVMLECMGGGLVCFSVIVSVGAATGRMWVAMVICFVLFITANIFLIFDMAGCTCGRWNSPWAYAGYAVLTAAILLVVGQKRFERRDL